VDTACKEQLATAMNRPHDDLCLLAGQQIQGVLCIGWCLAEIAGDPGHRQNYERG